MKTFMRFAVVVAGILLGISLSSGAWAEDNFWSANLKFKVELRPGIAAYVDTIYMLNLDHPSGGKTLLAIPGMGLTASSYQPVVGQLFAVEDHSHSKVFSAAILVDYPGHAGSGLPKNDPGVDPLLFGNMILQDYVATMLGVMDQLPLL
ncbi:MAG TPA: hypothetical protein VE398_20770, partial [Acidobacteriota bacterium]|nr:hypothetical protein [Acidobacteriota bacterium]